MTEKVALTIFDPEKIRYENALIKADLFKEIKTYADAKDAKALSIGMNQFIKLVNEKRLEETKPDRDKVTRFNDYVNSIIDLKKLDEISKDLINKVATFDREQKAIENAKQIDNVTERLEAMKVGVTIQTKTETVEPIAKTKDNWVAELIDFNLVDKEHKTVDWDSVNSQIKAGVREMNGFVIKNVPIAVRR